MRKWKLQFALLGTVASSSFNSKSSSETVEVHGGFSVSSAIFTSLNRRSSSSIRLLAVCSHEIIRYQYEIR